MKIISVTMIKDEADIVESFVRYNACFVDGMIIADHMSSDRTLEILNKLKDEGYPLWIKTLDKPEYNQPEVVEDMRIMALDELGADWVLALDADEFLESRVPGKGPREVLESLNPSVVQRVFWKNYFPVEGDNTEELFVPKRMVSCCNNLGLQNFKAIISKEVSDRGNPCWTGGSHDVIINNDVEVLTEAGGELCFAHYPLRSFEQIRRKVYLMWINKQALFEDPMERLYIKTLYEYVVAAKQLSYEEIKKFLARTYFQKLKWKMKFDIEELALDLSYCQNMELKYTNKEEVDVEKSLVENSVRLAIEYARHKVKLPKARYQLASQLKIYREL